MKNRTFFVSNSSSCSFIISVSNKENEPCPTCGRRDPDFIDFIANMSGEYGGDDTGIRAIGLENISSKFCEDIGYYDMDKKEKDRWNDLLGKVKDEEAAGNRVALISISYHDDITNDEFFTQTNNGKVKKLWSDH
jgi:hypothetical protein